MTSAEQRSGPVEVLLVEDNPGDVRLTREAFRSTSAPIHLHVASDGVDAMAFLREGEAGPDVPRPDLILLDLNLPRMDGREVLASIKGDPGLKSIPTLILTSSRAEADVLRSYELQANAYLCKPLQLDAFEALIASTRDFWFSKARLPRGQRG